MAPMDVEKKKGGEDKGKKDGDKKKPEEEAAAAALTTGQLAADEVCTCGVERRMMAMYREK